MWRIHLPPQSLQHGATRDEIESTNAIHTQQSCVPVQISGGLDDVRHALTSRLGGESELEQRSCTFDGGCQLLSESARNQSSQEITKRDSSHHPMASATPSFCPSAKLQRLRLGFLPGRTPRTCTPSRSESNTGRTCSAVIPDGSLLLNASRFSKSSTTCLTQDRRGCLTDV